MERSALFWPERQRRSVGHGGSIMKAPSVKTVRCAIYTRVSTEHGLDQEHLHEEAVDKKGMSRRETKVGVRRVTVNGEARDAERYDRLGPRGPTPSKGVP